MKNILWIGFLTIIIGGFVILLSQILNTTLDPNRPYTTEVYEGKVIALSYADNGTYAYLDGYSGAVYIPKRNLELIKGATYKFTFKRWHDWVSNNSEYQNMELVSQ